MKQCALCTNTIPVRLEVNGKIHNLQRRKFCLTCSPFGKHNTHDLTKSIQTRQAYDPNGHGSYASVKKFRKNKKKKCVEYLGGSCILCGYKRCPEVLHFHHRDPTRKDFAISAANSWNFERVRKELDKCVLLCANCHGEVHAGFVVLHEGTAPSSPPYQDDALLLS